MKHSLYFPFNLRSGAKLILVYVLVAYLIPGLLVGLAGVPEIYFEVPLNRLALGALLLFFLIYLVLGNLCPRPGVTPREHYHFRFIGTGPQIGILALLTVAAVYGFATDLSGFRYSDVRLSERGSLPALVFSLVPTVLQFFLLIYIFYDRGFAERRGPAQVLKKTLLLAGLFLSANGIATMLLATLATVYVLFPQTFGRFLLRTTDSTRHSLMARLRHRVNLIVLFCALGAAAASAWILGESTKRGELGSVLELVTGEGILEWFLEWTVLRLSPSYISLVTALDYFALSMDWRVISEHLMAPVESFLFRANFLLLQLFDVIRPEDGSIMRINYNLITVNPTSLRSGSSPGLIAGFLLSFPFPLNLAVLTGYLLFVQRFLSRLIAALPGRLTLAGWPIFLIFMLPLFASPIDLLLIVDDGTFAFALLVMLRNICIRRTQVEVNHNGWATRQPI